MKVLNIGSLNIDKTYSVKHFVRPEETVKALKYDEFCGGKGLNQSIALVRAGAEVYHAGAVGKDGKMLTEILEASGVHTEYIQKLDTASGHAVIQVDEKGQNNIIICGGANDSISKEFICSVLEHFETGDIVLLQNEISNVDFAVSEAKRKGLTVAFNPSPMNEGIRDCALELVDLFLLNEVEGKLLAGIESEEPECIMNALKDKFKLSSVLLTLGENGAYFFNHKETVFQEIYKVRTVDTTGAGDTFCGYFLAGITKGFSCRECLQNAAAASAIVVSRMGAAPGIPVWDEVAAFKKENT